MEKLKVICGINRSIYRLVDQMKHTSAFSLCEEAQQTPAGCDCCFLLCDSEHHRLSSCPASRHVKGSYK